MSSTSRLLDISDIKSSIKDRAHSLDGSYIEFAETHGVSPVHLIAVLTGREVPSKKILKVFDLEKIVVYQQKKIEQSNA